MQVPNRFYNGSDYRYGFQGQEKDNEIKGEGNSLNYTFRMHDPRIGRFFAVDPLAKKYPWYTPYSFSGNKPIQFVELEGLEEADPNGDGMLADVAIRFYDGVRNTVFQPIIRGLSSDEIEGRTIREALTALGHEKLIKHVSNKALGETFKLKSVGSYYDVFKKEDAVSEIIDFGFSTLDVVSAIPQKNQVFFAIKTGGLGNEPMISALKQLALKSGVYKLSAVGEVAIEGIATAIGRMEDLKKYDAFKNVDTWYKTGRMPAVGDLPVSWKENRKWLQAKIDRGDTFIMTMDPSKLPKARIEGVPNGYFTKLEYDMLIKQGAKIIHDYKKTP